MIGKNTEKSPGDLRRLAVTQTPVKDHQLRLVWKSSITIATTRKDSSFVFYQSSDSFFFFPRHNGNLFIALGSF